MEVELVQVNTQKSSRVRIGPRTCYWCGSDIEFTISSIHWWCSVCRRYTGDDIPEDLSSINHVCAPSPYSTLDNRTVTMSCLRLLSFCDQDPIFKTQSEYSEYIQEHKKVMYTHSIEWAEHVDEKLKENQSKRGRAKVLSTPTDFVATKVTDPNFNSKFAQFTKSLEKERVRKLTRDRKRNSR